MNGHIALELAADIRANVDALYASEIGFDFFNDRARVLWARAAADPELHSVVRHILRLPVAR